MSRRGFWSEEEGGLAVEFAVLFPVLMLLYTAMFVFWDAFQTRAVTVRATETIADMMSRESGSFDEAYLDGMNEVFDWLTSARSSTDLRMTAIGTTLDAEGEEALTVFWSRSTGADLPALDEADLGSEVPTPSIGEQLIVLESFYAYVPIFDVGISPRRFRYLVASRPRYVPQILWAGL